MTIPKPSQIGHSVSVRHACLAAVLLLVLVLFWIPQPLVAQPSVNAQPGAVNPALTYTEWPDDELFIALPVLASTNQSSIGLYVPNSTLTSTVLSTQRTFAEGAGPTSMSAGAGRILDRDRESVVLAYRDGTNVAVSFFQPVTAAPVATFPNLGTPIEYSTDFYDVAVGDLDGLPVQDGEYRDEVVVAYAQGAANNLRPVTVAVLDFGGVNESAPQPRAVTTATGSGTLDAADITFLGAGKIGAGDSTLDTAVGDFDGDGLSEIVVAYLSAPRGLTLDVFRYIATVDAHGVIQRSLTRVGSSVVPPARSGAYYNGALGLAMADFDGDLRAELALGTTEILWDQFFHIDNINRVDLRTFRLAGTVPVTITAVASAELAANNNLGGFTTVQLASGLFKVDPGNGWDLNRRQIVAASNSVEEPVNLRYALINKDLSINLVGSVNLAEDFRFWMASGGYAGDRSGDDAFWHVDVIAWDAYDKRITHYFVQPRNAAFDVIANPLHWTTKTDADFNAERYPVVAVDIDGDTTHLGAPAHITAEDVVSTDFILEEPPKHTYWDPVAKLVTTISRYDGFNITLVSSTGQEFSSTSKDTSNYSTGSSKAGSAGETVTGNIGYGIFKASAEVSAQASKKVGEDYDEHESSYTSTYGDRKASFTGATNRDDYIVGRQQTLDIWRYPILGMEDPDPTLTPYYEVVLPGPYTAIQTNQGGSSVDWYQPLHENGNILSYAAYNLTTTFNPPDLGEFTIACANCPGGVQTVKGLILEPSKYSWDGDGNSVSLSFSTSSGGGTERSYTKTMCENTSVKIAAKATVSIGGPKNNISSATTASGEVEFHSKNSWGSTATANYKTTSSTGITLNKVAGNARQGYDYYPVLYVTTDGTIKATYAVDPLSNASGRTFWVDNYGQKPDLALNLPYRFYSIATTTGQAWTADVSSLRKSIRGFFVRKAEINPVTGDHDYISRAAYDGELVLLETRVYNYSVSQPVPAGAKVRFVAVPYDDATNKELEPRVVISETILPRLEPRQMVTTTVLWNTLGASKGATQHYRIYVVLDPDNAVNEKYETESDATRTFCDAATGVCVDPGQNNEGYAYATVTTQLYGDPNWNKPATDVSLAADGLAALDMAGNLAVGTVQAPYGRPLQLRVRVDSDTPSTDFSQVLIYDGDPEQGGLLIAGKSVFSGSPQDGGDMAWLRWVPETGGTHVLYAKIMENTLDPHPGNNVSTLTVEVQGGPPNNLYLPVVGR